MRSNSAGTVFRDVITLALFGFVAIVVILLMHIRPPTEETSGDSPPGNITVEIQWPPGWDTDVDLWVRAPGDVPVGYSNKGGIVFNLLRDDLGQTADVGDANYEYSYSRGIPAGEYTVNLHLYSNTEAKFPVPVIVQIRANTMKNGSPLVRELLRSTVNLLREKEELTVFRFKLTRAGDLVKDSVHHVYKPLRNWNGSR